jgi:hypothetical protein
VVSNKEVESVFANAGNGSRYLPQLYPLVDTAIRRGGAHHGVALIWRDDIRNWLDFSVGIATIVVVNTDLPNQHAADIDVVSFPVILTPSQ